MCNSLVADHQKIQYFAFQRTHLKNLEIIHAIYSVLWPTLAYSPLILHLDNSERYKVNFYT